MNLANVLVNLSNLPNQNSNANFLTGFSICAKLPVLNKFLWEKWKHKFGLLPRGGVLQRNKVINFYHLIKRVNLLMKSKFDFIFQEIMGRMLLIAVYLFPFHPLPNKQTNKKNHKNSFQTPYAELRKQIIFDKLLGVSETECISNKEKVIIIIILSLLLLLL